MVRYYGWYSNKSRGMRAKEQAAKEERGAEEGRVEIIDVSHYVPSRVPSKRWRDLIRKVWEVDPLVCPRCGGEMRVIALIHDEAVIEKILRHVALWPEPEQCPARSPPEEVTYEPFYDDLPPEGF